MRLDCLHNVIQIAMGWTDSHLHQYLVGSGFARTFYGQPDPEFADMGNEMLNEKRYTVADVAPSTRRKFSYEYDFGDSWDHEVVLEKILPPDAAFKHLKCLAGANASPPEDCGGLWGYYNLLEALADSKHPEHEEMIEWMGGAFDPARFDLNAVNAALKQLKA